MRLFLAINLPAEVRREVDAAAAPMRECLPELSWVPESHLHLTLKFLGEQPPERVEDIKNAMAGVAARHRELFVAVGEIGAFPNFRRARVVWMGVNHDPRMELLHHDVEMACERLGFELEARAFRPHLTLARVKHAMPEERMRALARVAKRTDYRSDFIVRSIDLMESVLGASGSTYTTLVSAALRS